METSVLGRAEWMRFYGMLFGKQAQGDSLFANVEKEYLSLKKQVVNALPKPSVICDLKSGSAWVDLPPGAAQRSSIVTDSSLSKYRLNT